MPNDPIDQKFSFITVGQIVKELQAEGVYKFARSTFYRLEKNEKLHFPQPNRTIGNWRSYSREAAEEIKRIIKQAYGLS
jgi:hypothetical protein